MESCILPTGTLRYSPGRACDGYTLFSPMRQKQTFLIDMEGYIVHQWAHDTTPGLYSVLLENGNLLRGALCEPKYTDHGGEGGAVQEIDWDGNIVWEYRHHRPESCQHHAFKRMSNGNTLILCWRRYSWEEARERGRLEQWMPAPDLPEYQEGLWVNFVEEVTPAGSVVWSWNMWDHAGGAPDCFDLNYVVSNQHYKQGLLDWAHVNNVDDVPEHGEILLCSRTFSEFMFVSRKTGRITYRFGNPAASGRGQGPSFIDPGDQQLFGPHCATWLGDGKVLVFDNGWMHPLGNRSRMLIVDRSSDSIIWQWHAGTGNSFYSAIQSGVQLLPNGNVLACATEHGHFVEVDPSGGPNGSGGEIVWEFVNPMTKQGPRAILTEATNTGSPATNAVHRAHRYVRDYPGLAGRQLTRKTPFVPQCPEGPWKAWGELIGCNS